MSTKTEIQTKINTIETGVLNPAATVRAVLGTDSDSFLENFYGTEISDTNASTNIVTEVATGKNYNLNFTKQGRTVVVDGKLTNLTGGLTSINEPWFSITNTEYEQNTTAKFISGVSKIDGSNIRFVLSAQTFSAIEPMANGEQVEINFSYNTSA